MSQRCCILLHHQLVHVDAILEPLRGPAGPAAVMAERYLVLASSSTMLPGISDAYYEAVNVAENFFHADATPPRALGECGVTTDAKLGCLHVALTSSVQQFMHRSRAINRGIHAAQAANTT
jgi:hypothetical protein